MNIAFIPVRGGSKSIPLKNIKKINNRPLIYWVLDAANNCDSIDKIVVSTDSNDIRKCINDYKSDKIEVFDRSIENATDNASTESAMLEYAEKCSFENMILIQATSPLLQSEDLERGIKEFNKKEVDSVLSVVRQKRFIWKVKENKLEAQNYDYMNRPRRQEFDGFLVENGAFYITTRENLLKTKCRISGNISYVEMPEESYFEIDEISDWIIVEQLLSKRNVRPSISKIKMLLTDSDGVLTDGGMYYSETGDEMKKFNTKDGMAFQLLKNNGIIVGIITGEERELVRNRANKMKVDELHMGIKDKIQVVRSLCKKYDIGMDQVAYIGDDINDLDVIKEVGFGCSVNDAMECVKNIAKYVTKTNGGSGAVREVAEIILQGDTSW